MSFWARSGDQPDLIRDLTDAEAHYMSVLEIPEATEADRVEAAELLEEVETRIYEAEGRVGSAANLNKHQAEQEPEAEF